MDQSHFLFHIPERRRPSMLALSVRQPWAHLIATGAKRYENRSWQTDHRGDLLIHASRGRDDLARLSAREREQFGLPDDEGLTFGALVCVVCLVNIVPASEVAGEPFVEGPLCWVLEDPRPVEPVPVPGRLMLFPVDEALIRPARTP